METVISIFLLVFVCLGAVVWAENEVGKPPPAPSERISRIAELEQRIMVHESMLAAVLEKISHLKYEEGEINGLSGPHLIVEGANFHVRNHTGATDGVDGLGNLIVGYNEPYPLSLHNRKGSHNLVVGREHYYESFGGFVAGFQNIILGPEASVSGGNQNWATGKCSSVSGGLSGVASGDWSSIGGGNSNAAAGTWSSVSGGNSNTAAGTWSSISGGEGNIASSPYSSVNGGSYNTAFGPVSSISGGSGNTASGFYSSVSGGYDRTVTGDYDWAAGGLFQEE